ncbi:hypothetical protein [Cellulomonas phragmiteti]|nr:hypothetical protein [Cellulomonas phragmiteti]
MNNDTERDVFAHIQHESGDGAALRADRLADALRTVAPLRKVFVQRQNTESERPSLLGKMVRARAVLPLRTFLLVHALEPVLEPWPLGTWAKLVGGTSAHPPSTEAVSRAFNSLVNLKLVERAPVGNGVRITPLLEDGSGRPFERASGKDAEVGPGYLVIPDVFWTSGLADRLKLPGLAMFLVALHETTQEQTYQIALERMAEWYGISERTAERGYLELSKEQLLLTHTQWVRDRKMRTPKGLVPRVHRALASPYSKAARDEAQAKNRKAARKAAAGATTAAAPPA